MRVIMIALIQRVSQAHVDIDGCTVARIGRGILAFLGVERHDDELAAERLVDRIVHYRIFEDDRGRMNASLLNEKGQLLLVPQFTLLADTTRGTRPGFSRAAPPDLGRRCFEQAVTACRRANVEVCCGIFGANMQVSLINEGPATFWLSV